jgi:hypothetical protein
VTDLLKILSYGDRKKPLLGNRIPKSGNNRRIAFFVTIEKNDHCYATAW